MYKIYLLQLFTTTKLCYSQTAKFYQINMADEIPFKTIGSLDTFFTSFPPFTNSTFLYKKL